MSQKRTFREKVILTLAGGLALTYVFVEFIGDPLYQKQKSQKQNIESKTLFLSKYNEILNQTAYYREKEQANKTLATQIEKLFLSPSQPALAAAGLQKSLEEKARKTNVSLVQVRTEKTKYMENLLAVPVQITVKSSLEKLSRFIQLIESDGKFLVIEELAIRRINKKEPEQLESRLLVNGFIQKRKPEKLKTT
ncbi:MAG: type II secretion system protein GspM [Nitrospinota bacterium]|nr:type II secretion system protein GspM [Nitrospinota bacterium]